MTKTLWLVAIVVLALVGAAVVWWTRGEPAPGRDSATTFLTLQTDRTDGREITAGAPVFLTVTLSGQEGATPALLESSADAWIAEVRFETSDGVLPWRVEQLGRPLTASGMSRTLYGVGPEAAAQIAPGTYVIRAVLPIARNQQIRSNAATVKIGGQQASAAQAEREVLRESARFYLEAGRFEPAHALALRLVEASDADAEAFIFLGDALNGLRRDDEALAAYQEALAMVSEAGGMEPPDYLMFRMHEVRTRIHGAGQ